MIPRSGFLSRASLLRVAVVVVGVAWLFAVLFNYYTVHKPFGLANAIALVDDLANVGVAAALYLLAAALGRRILSHIDFRSQLEAIVFQTGVGLGLISFATLALGLVGLLNRLLFWGVLLVALVLLRNDLRTLGRDLAAYWRTARVSGARLALYEKAFVLFVLALLALGLISALTPTLAWDALVYHLVIGKQALARGAIVSIPENPPLNFPALVEMLYLAAMVLKGDGSASLIHFGFLLLIAGGLVALCIRFLTARVGLYAVMVLVAAPSFLLTATGAYNDMALAFYAFAAFFALMNARQDARPGWYVLAGVCAGFALGEKYLGIAVPVGLGVLVLWTDRPFLRKSIMVSVAAVITAAPWYLRNWLVLGTPVYPFFAQNTYWDAYRASQLTPPGDMLTHPLELLAIPWNMTVMGVDGSVSFGATIGPFFLMLIPLSLLAWRHGDRIVSSALGFCLVLFGVWVADVIQSPIALQSRYFYMAFPLLALLAAVALDRLPSLNLPQFSFARFTRLAVLLVLMFTLWEQVVNWVQLNPLGYLVGIESRDQFLKARLGPPGYYDALQFVSKLPAGSKVLFLWEPRDYYAAGKAQTQSDWILDAWGHLVYRYHDVDSIYQALVAQGYTHILVNRWGLDFQLVSQDRGFSFDLASSLQDLTTRYGVLVYGRLPLVFTTDASGVKRVVDADKESYAIYELAPP
ncbi:MAG: glycosyltransferase family 39 protein [Anaerolineae bacterium]